MTTHTGLCQDCYTSHVGHAYIVIHCKACGGASYVVSIDDDSPRLDEYDDEGKTLDERAP